MPTEPERDIEKTLRAYAKKRQEQAGAPAELHPATRRLLQGEVARLRGGKTPEKSSLWAKWFGGSWPRMAISVAALVVLAAVVAALLQPAVSNSKRRSTFEMAQPALKDAENLSDGRKLALNSPQPGSREIADQSKVREDTGGNRAAGETQTYSLSSSAPALRAPLDQKKQGADKNGQFAAAKSLPSIRDRGVMQGEVVQNGLNKRELSEPVPAAPSATVAASAPEFDTSTAAAANSNSRLALESQQLKSLRAPAPAPVAAPAAPPVVATTPADLPPNTIAFDNRRVTNHSLAEAPVAVFANSAGFAGKPAKAATTDSLGVSANSWSQRFARANSTNQLSRRQRTISRTVLRSFRVEENGNQIRFIDSDGSVYSGLLGTAEDVEGRRKLMTVGPADADVAERFEFKATNSANLDGATANKSLQNLYFRVSGTNRSLRQPVVFTGKFLPVSAVGGGEQSNLSSGSVNESLTPPSGALNWQLFNSQLQGQILVGGSNKMDFKAVPVKR